MQKYLRYLAPVARLAFVVYFANAVYNYLTNYSGTLQGMARFGVPLPEVALPVTIVVFVLGIVSLLIGYQTRIMAGALAVWMLVITVFYHAGIADPLQLRAFLSNFAVIAGLLLLVTNGAGPLSLDERSHPVGETEPRHKAA